MRRRPVITGPFRRRLVALLACVLVTVVACGGDDEVADPPATTSTTAPDSTSTTSTTAPPVELPADRPIEVHVPPSVTGDEPVPLVVLLHGYGVDGATQTGYLGMTEAADEAGMLLVAPDGTENAAGQRFWNATDACCDRGMGVDDSAYIAAVIATVAEDHDVDPDRVFLVGHSNGGFMSFRMACDHADLVAAVVTIAGATHADAAECQPSAPVSTLQVHGTADATIAYDGGDIDGDPYPSASETLAQWAELDGCDPEPDDPAPADRTIVVDQDPATVTAHSGCDDGTTVELWTQPEGVHIPAFTADFSDQILAWLADHART